MNQVELNPYQYLKDSNSLGLEIRKNADLEVRQNLAEIVQNSAGRAEILIFQLYDSDNPDIIAEFETVNETWINFYLKARQDKNIPVVEFVQTNILDAVLGHDPMEMEQFWNQFVTNQ